MRSRASPQRATIGRSTSPSDLLAVSPSRSPHASLAAFNVRFGLWALLAYLTLGLALEGLHGFKVAWYLEYETRRLMWTLAHAHGVLTSLLAIGFGVLLQLSADPAPWQRVASACLL